MPQPGGDSGKWGNILNDYLSQSHKTDGSLKDDSVGSAQLRDDSITAATIVDGSISESLLASAVQSKLNAAASINWTSLSGKPPVVVAGSTTQEAANVLQPTFDARYQPLGGNSGATLQQIPVAVGGDSLVANIYGARWTSLMTALGRSDSTSQRYGIGSQKTDQIAARQGGKPATVSSAVTIPAGTSAVAFTPSLDFLQGTGVATGATRSVPAVVMGVQGTVTATNPGSTPWTYTFTRSQAGYAVIAPAGTVIQAGFEYMNALPIWWAYRNSALLAGAITDIPVLLEYMLKRSAYREHALILSIPPIAASEAIGQTNRTTIDAVNAAVRNAFPANFVDAAAWLRDPNVITALGYTLTAQDNTDIANGLTPTQLTSDGLHLNDAGYTVLFALLEQEYVARGLKAAGTVTTTAPAIATATLPEAKVGQAYSQTLTATGSTPITWSVTSGSLPAGLSLSSGGVVSGTPTAQEVKTFTITATNSAGSSAQSYTVASTTWAAFTSDGFSGSGSLYGGSGNPNRTTDIALGGSGVAYTLGSNADRFQVDGELKAGSAPLYSTIGVATGLDNARASIKITQKLVNTTSTAAVVVLDCARSIIGSSGVTSLGVRVTQAATSQVLGARINMVDSGGTAVQSPSSTTIVVGDTIGVSTEWSGSTCTVTMWLNGVPVETMTYTGTKPSTLSAISAGSTSDTTWRLDNFVVEHK